MTIRPGQIRSENEISVLHALINKSNSASSEKKCSQCEKKKHTSEFNKWSGSKDGLRAYCRACQNEAKKIYIRGTEMKKSKFNGIYNGLSSVAKKIYEAIPIQDEWDLTKVIAETKRVFPSIGDHKMIMGCVNTLVRSGLVLEINGRVYRRAKIDFLEGKEMQKDNVIKNEIDTKAVTPNKLTPLEKIGSLQKIAARLAADAKELLEAIDTVAIEVDEQFSARDEESKKLKQLQQLLKSLA